MGIRRFQLASRWTVTHPNQAALQSVRHAWLFADADPETRAQENHHAGSAGNQRRGCIDESCVHTRSGWRAGRYE